MHLLSFSFAGYALIALLLLKLTLYLHQRRRQARVAASLGCLPPPTAPNHGFFGLGTLLASVRATRDEWGPIWMHQALNALSPHTNDIHTVRAPVFDYELLITRDVTNVKAIFATNAADWDIGPHREKCFKSLLGQGVMTGRGEKWRHSRALVRGQFARDNLADLGLLQRHLDAFVGLLMAKVKNDGSGASGWTEKVDLGPMFYTYTLDVSTEFLFGQSVHLQDPVARSRLALSWERNAPDLASFGHHLDSAKHVIDRRGALAKYGWLFFDNEYPKHCKEVQGFVDFFVKERLARSDDEKVIETASGKKKFVLLEELAKETQDPLELRNELLNVLHASRDTTAALMGWIFYFLARRPDLFNKLRTDIVDTFTADPHAEVSFAVMMACSPLQHMINETIRMIGIVPMNERAATRDTTLPRGGGPDGNSPVFVPKGRQVLIPTYSMQHRKDIWGEDVEEFKPERWQNRKFGWDFIPFGGGARQCLGQQFARTEASYVLVRMLQNFDAIENLEPPGSLKMHHTIENRSGTGVQVRLHAASPSAVSAARYDDLDLGLGPERRESVAE